MLDQFGKLWGVLDPQERRLTLIVFGLLVAAAFVETAGVASIMPFMAVLADPNVVHTNQSLARLYDVMGFESTDAYLFFLGVTFLVVMVASLAFRALVLWVQLRFAQQRNHAWTCRLVENYLNRPYDWFLGEHSGTLGASVLNETGRVVDGSLFPAMQVVSLGLVATFLLALMIFVDVMLAMSIILALGGTYVLLFVTVRHYLARLGMDIRSTNRQRFKLTQEMFGGIKNVKVAGLEGVFLERFRGWSLLFSRRTIMARVVAELPSFAVQALVFGGIMIVFLYFLSERGGLEHALPVFSLYALAGYRMMPALQGIYGNLSQLKVTGAVLDALHENLRTINESSAVDELTSADLAVAARSNEAQRIQLIDASYVYPGAERHALKDINLEIRGRSKVGLVGPTGSGKTTLVDLILALLEPSSGSLVVDGRPVTGPLRRAWQARIGYVPQEIFLTDDSVEGNIAFGVSEEKRDRDAVRRAARIANLDDFVVSELPDGYATMIGERGVRLSGGQRQRIGIARALYRDPDVLILDEATSALDKLTELAVMDAVRNLGDEKTIILIAHRLSTVRDCDLIFYLDHGRVVASGTFEELRTTNSQFRRLAGLDA